MNIATNQIYRISILDHVLGFLWDPPATMATHLQSQTLWSHIAKLQFGNINHPMAQKWRNNPSSQPGEEKVCHGSLPVWHEEIDNDPNTISC